MKKNYFLFFLISFKLLAQNPELDPTFNSKETGIYQQDIGSGAVVLPDNKILTVFESGNNYNVMLLNPDGSPDKTFNTTDSFATNDIRIFAKSDGAFITLQSGNKVRAFNANGTLNSVFATTTLTNVTSTPVQVRNIIYQDDGKAIIHGLFDIINDIYKVGMVRLNTDGSIDSTYKLQSGGNKFILFSDGKSVTMTGTNIYRYLANGKNDPTFKINTTIDPVQKYVTNGFETENNSSINDIAVQPDGKIIAVGCNFKENGKTFSYQIVRLNTDGTRDPSFKKFDSQTANITKIYLQKDNKIVLNIENSSFIRLNTDGTTDNTFKYYNTVSMLNEGALSFQENKMIISGNFKDNEGKTRAGIHRINSDGSIDLTFNPHSGPNLFFDEWNSKTSYPFTAKTLLDQKILLAGDFSTYNDKPVKNLCRITQSGELDPTFNVDPAIKIYADITQNDYVIIPQNDGKIVLLHNNGISVNGKGTSIIRLNSDGSIDNSFNFNPYYGNTGGAVTKDIKILNNGKFLIVGENGFFTTKVGNYYSYNVIQLNSDGSIDPNYNANFFHKPLKICTLSSNKVLISFLQDNYNYTYSPVLRLNENGTTDSSFKSGNLLLHRIKELNDGKLLAINNNSLLTRLNSDGSTDASFTSYSFAKANINNFDYYENGQINLFISSISADSTKKLTFSSEGTLQNTVEYNTNNNFEIQNCEDVLFYGYIKKIGNVNKNGIVRYKTSNTTSSPNPAGEIFQPFTNGQTLADLKITGADIKWYTIQTNCGINSKITKKGNELSETILPLSTLLVNGTTYYASQSSNGIESSYRLPITVYSATLSTIKYDFPNLVTHPNPVKDIFDISNSEQINKVEVYSLSGQLISGNTYNTNNVKIDFSALNSGLYFVKIHTEDKVAIIKTIKN